MALKILPEVFASDPNRMMRFQREAEVLPSLDHPNIAHIYELEDRALVMELVEANRLKAWDGVSARPHLRGSRFSRTSRSR